MARRRSNIFSALFLLLGGVVFMAGHGVAGSPARAEPKVHDQIEDLYGDWRNVNSQARMVRRIAISPGGSGVKVHVWGDCGNRDCDWGVSGATVFQSSSQSEREPGTAVHVQFQSDVGASHLIIMRNPRNEGAVVQVFNRDKSGSGHDQGPDEIRPVEKENTYAIERFKRVGDAPAFDDRPYASGPRNDDRRRPDDRDGRDPYADGRDRDGPRNDRYAGGEDRYGDSRPRDRFDRPSEDRYGEPGGRRDDYGRDRRDYDGRRHAGGEECIPFDPERLDLSRVDGRWKVADGREGLFDFGYDRDSAERALEVIHRYRFDQGCSLGHSERPFTYLLRRGDAAPGRFGGEECERLELDRLDVREVGGRFWVVSGRREIYDFGPREDDAHRALEIMQRHGFGAMCHVGRADSGVVYFLR